MSIHLKQTCGACPEQYDAFDESGNQVGYLRLRHGYFYVECPDTGGTTVYEAHPEGDGCFEYEERDYFLKHAVHAIERWMKDGSTQSRPPAPDVEYTVDFE